LSSWSIRTFNEQNFASSYSSSFFDFIPSSAFNLSLRKAMGAGNIIYCCFLVFGVEPGLVEKDIRSSGSGDLQPGKKEVLTIYDQPGGKTKKLSLLHLTSIE
jgi:hypothetical protein